MPGSALGLGRAATPHAVRSAGQSPETSSSRGFPLPRSRTLLGAPLGPGRPSSQPSGLPNTASSAWASSRLWKAARRRSVKALESKEPGSASIWKPFCTYSESSIVSALWPSTRAPRDTCRALSWCGRARTRPRAAARAAGLPASGVPRRPPGLCPGRRPPTPRAPLPPPLRRPPELPSLSEGAAPGCFVDAPGAFSSPPRSPGTGTSSCGAPRPPSRKDPPGGGGRCRDPAPLPRKYGFPALAQRDSLRKAPI